MRAVQTGLLKKLISHITTKYHDDDKQLGLFCKVNKFVKSNNPQLYNFVREHCDEYVNLENKINGAKLALQNSSQLLSTIKPTPSKPVATCTDDDDLNSYFSDDDLLPDTFAPSSWMTAYQDMLAGAAYGETDT